MGFGRTIGILLGAAVLQLTAAGAAPAWEKTVTTLPRGDFPNPRPLVATYNFGWNDVVAAAAEIRFDKSGEQLQLQAAGGTVGMVRALWKFNTRHRAVADASTLRPVSLHQVDSLRSKTVTTDIAFHRDSLERVRTDTKTNKTPKPKTFQFDGGIFDMHSALLSLRSQLLQAGDPYRVVVYPATSPYLATLTVAAREKITIAAGTYPAIRFEVQLNKIGKDRELAPHKKFRHASVWLSDDPDRLLLRIEASIFVGKVFAEMQAVRFPAQGK
ncbi:MAG: DUF3108 domain-containing protein [Chthoniobacterales bacterium]|nr:DUF3108 domain-containing protein [Chthoniobacterales bacterium]